MSNRCTHVDMTPTLNFFPTDILVFGHDRRDTLRINRLRRGRPWCTALTLVLSWTK